jgi:hypothetical protein
MKREEFAPLYQNKALKREAYFLLIFFLCDNARLRGLGK